MSRTDLQVPFQEKDEVKRLGARWDGINKVWYVPDGVDTAPFQRWLPEINIRASSYFIAEASRRCWKCEQPTRVYGFLLPAGHEVAEYPYEGDPDEDSDDEVQAWLENPESRQWVLMEVPAFIHYVGYISPAIAARIQAIAPRFRVDFSQTTQSSYWMNHCDHCGMKQGDFEMYYEPHGAFCPLSEAEAAQIALHDVDEAFEASCDGSSHNNIQIVAGGSPSGTGAALIDFMRRI
ncbi:DUF5710 domain-containing protein [Xanthomonas citri]|uniref:DUF5710 domain-containing protein n=1 Tax=Xanthomonas citri TaxID=346 RepID=UPI001E36BFD3|nr:DUF5710 domain-containing protein [Xanthomonas citri]MCC4631527.1 DUF5710 domain-containing protein [Xanthomonas citri]